MLIISVYKLKIISGFVVVNIIDGDSRKTATTTIAKSKIWTAIPTTLPTTLLLTTTTTTKRSTTTKPSVTSTVRSPLSPSLSSLRAAASELNDLSIPATTITTTLYRFEINGLWQQLPPSGGSSTSTPYGTKISDCFNVCCARGGGNNIDDTVQVSCAWVDEDEQNNRNIHTDSMSALIQVNVVVDVNKNNDDDDHHQESQVQEVTTDEIDNLEILLWITVKQYECIEFFKATLSHVQGETFNHMVDPKLNDPYPTVIQSTIVEQKKQSDGSGSRTKYSRVYERSGIGKMLSYKQHDVVASVRLVTTSRQ